MPAAPKSREFRSTTASSGTEMMAPLAGDPDRMTVEDALPSCTTAGARLELRRPVSRSAPSFDRSTVRSAEVGDAVVSVVWMDLRVGPRSARTRRSPP